MPPSNLSMWRRYVLDGARARIVAPRPISHLVPMRPDGTRLNTHRHGSRPPCPSDLNGPGDTSPTTTDGGRGAILRNPPGQGIRPDLPRPHRIGLLRVDEDAVRSKAMVDHLGGHSRSGGGWRAAGRPALVREKDGVSREVRVPPCPSRLRKTRRNPRPRGQPPAS